MRNMWSLSAGNNLRDYGSKIAPFTGTLCMPHEVANSHDHLYLGVEVEFVLTFTGSYPASGTASSTRRASTAAPLTWTASRTGSSRPPSPNPPLVDNPSRLYQKLASQMDGFIMLKKDSSLPFGGAELNTAPATLEYHKSGVWEGFFDFPSDPDWVMKAFTLEQCGLHIHASRAFFTPLALSKLACFFGDGENQTFLCDVGQRPGGHYNTYTLNSYASIMRNRLGSYSHHHALNLSPPNTIEFRIFRSVTSRSAIFASLEFVHAISTYCSTAATADAVNPKSKSRKQRGWQSYCDWLSQKEQLKAYPNHAYHMFLIKYIPNAPKPKDWAHDRRDFN